MSFGSVSTVRPGTGTGDGSGGVTFYFNGTGTIGVVANSGTKSGIDDFNTLTGPLDSTGNAYPNDATHTNVTYTMGVKCLSSSSVPNNIFNSGAGVNIGSDNSNSPSVQKAPTFYWALAPDTTVILSELLNRLAIGVQRWFLFFQDRSATGLNGNTHPLGETASFF